MKETNLTVHETGYIMVVQLKLKAHTKKAHDFTTQI